MLASAYTNLNIIYKPSFYTIKSCNVKTHLYSAVLLVLPLFGIAQTKPVAVKSNAIASSLNSWSLRGNSNLTDSVNFLGTTDQHRLTFKVNNNKSGFIDFDSVRSNTAFGYQTLVSPGQYAVNNTAIGYQSLTQDTFGYENVAIGVRALYHNKFGQNNLALGNGALFTNDGNYNIAIGPSTLNANIGGGENVGIGFNALLSNQYGSDNVAIGLGAMQNNMASSNTAVGHSAMYNNSTGTYNATNGYLSLYNNTVGSDNTATGATALFNNTTGYYNTAFGMQALITNQTGMRNTTIGAYADVAESNFKNATAIGFDALVDASFKVQVGNIYVKSIGGAVGWTNYSDERIKQDIKENVPGLVFINQLRPVTYHFNTKKEMELLGRRDSLNEASESQLESMQFTGFLAQEVDKAAKKANYDFSGVDKAGKIMGLRYSEFVVPLVKAVQELSAKNDSLQKAFDAVQARLSRIEAKLSDSQVSDLVAPSSVSAVTASTTLSVYPNPAKGNLSVSFNSNSSVVATIAVLDMAGSSIVQKSLSAKAGNNNINLNVGNLASGTYRLEIRTANTVMTKQFVKE